MEFCAKNPPAKLLGSPIADIKSYDGVKMIAQDGSWLMLRGSGTEPILRTYAEARSGAAVKKLLALGNRLTREV
jgi:phosphomannomutase